MIRQRVLLIGDAGQLNQSRTAPTFKSLFGKASILPDKTTIIFLGDNIYNNGLPEEEASDREGKEKILRKQLDWFRSIVGTRATGIVIPGNHDWDDGRRDGLKAIERQSR